MALGERLTEIAAIDGVERIRLGSLEPSCMTPELIDVLKGIPQICPHFHLSLQSGSDSVLKRMNRKYDTEVFRRVAADLRSAFADASLTTDMICGFPGETDAEHQESCAFAREIGFTHIHVFPFSPREGTKAWNMDGKTDGAVKAARTAELRAISDEMEKARAEEFVGKNVQVLLERQLEDGTWEGYCREYIRVIVSADPALQAGKIVDVNIRETRNFSVAGCVSHE